MAENKGRGKPTGSRTMPIRTNTRKPAGGSITRSLKPTPGTSGGNKAPREKNKR